MKNTVVEIKKERHEVFVGGKSVRLSKKEFLILLALKESNVTLSREDLFHSVWNAVDYPGHRIQQTTIDQHVARIRRKIKVPVIDTVYGFGYRYTNTN